jgi:hypothetical protein
MSNSKKIQVTDYIKDFAEKSAGEFKWYYVDLYSRAVFSTIVSLKSSRNVSINYLTNADKTLCGHGILFKLLGLRFVKKAYDDKIVPLILSNTVPSESPLFVNTFTAVTSSLHHDMLEIFPKIQADRSISVINLIYEASLVYCWHYLNIAESNNMVDKVVEELYLLKEIEGFKNRKGE